jgi:hypothetical protein
VRKIARQLTFALLIVPLFFDGCAAVAPLASLSTTPSTPSTNAKPLTMTDVRLTRQNFRVVKLDVVGETWGFKLFGIFTIVPATEVRAFQRMYKAAQLPRDAPITPVHVLVEPQEISLILFSIPQMYVRADFVEFYDDQPQGSPTNTALPPPTPVP